MHSVSLKQSNMEVFLTRDDAGWRPKHWIRMSRRRLLCGAVLAIAVRCGWAEAGDGHAKNTAVLGEQAACPLEALAAMRGRQISPRLPEKEAAAESATGNFHDVPARPESFRSHSSIIQRLPNGMIRKLLPGKPGETAAESKRRVLKEAEYMGTFYLYRNFPRVVNVDIEERAIYMEDCGRPVFKFSKVLCIVFLSSKYTKTLTFENFCQLTRQNVPCDWRRQLGAMLQVLQEHAVFHNDWLGLGWPDTPNLTEKDGILYLIDFTWATTGRDAYPFMNPSEALIARAGTMWDMLKLTRELHEHRRLRYQHALDRQSIRVQIYLSLITQLWLDFYFSLTFLPPKHQASRARPKSGTGELTSPGAWCACR